MPKFQVVELGDPYSNWDAKGMQSYFCKMIGLRMKGYQANHFEGVLPFDAADMISTHFLLCVEAAAGEYVPVLGYRSVALSKIEFHRQTFAPLAVAQLCQGPVHYRALEQVIDDCKRSGKELFYGSGYTIDPSSKQDPAIAPYLHEAAIAMHTLEHFRKGPRELVGAGNLRFKLDKFYPLYGYEPLKYEGKELGPLTMPQFAGDQMIFLHLKKYTKYAVDIAERWQPLWDERLIIGASQEEFQEELPRAA